MEKLDQKRYSDELVEIEQELLKRVVGQDRAVRRFVRTLTVDKAGLSAPGRPLANVLLLGPTGSGKTRLVEAGAEVLFGTASALIKIDCAELQLDHDMAKLIGSPPGYLGHNETIPLFTQQRLEQHYTDKLKISLVLFDEIEKASYAVWQLLLGIMDKATLTLGNNTRVDFSRSMLFMTSNLGSREMLNLVEGSIGFARAGFKGETADLDQKLYRIGIDAARRRFTAEFMNRLDKSIVFRSLTHEHLQRILDIELQKVQERLYSRGSAPQLYTTLSAKEYLLREGTDPKYGARHLKRAIERHVVFPLANILSSGQVDWCHDVIVDYDREKDELVFHKSESAVLKTPAQSETSSADVDTPDPLPAPVALDSYQHS